MLYWLTLYSWYRFVSSSLSWLYFVVFSRSSRDLLLLLLLLLIIIIITTIIIIIVSWMRLIALYCELFQFITRHYSGHKHTIRLHRRLTKNKTPENWEAYRKRNYGTSLKRSALRSYCINVFTNSQHPGKFWKKFHCLLSSRDRGNSQVQLIEDGHLITNGIDVANLLNDNLIIYITCILHFHGNIWTYKWPAPNVSGFIAQLVRASHRYREVTGSGPVEILNFFSGFFTQRLLIVMLYMPNGGHQS